MIDTIRHFFEERIACPDDLTSPLDRQRLQLACAALLLETANADRVIDELELDEIELAIGRAFQLCPEDANELMDLAERERSDVLQPYVFTSLVRSRFRPREKQELMDLLWRVAYADGQLDRFEEDLIYRIAELIGVPREQAAARRPG